MGLVIYIYFSYMYVYTERTYIGKLACTEAYIAHDDRLEAKKMMVLGPHMPGDSRLPVYPGGSQRERSSHTRAHACVAPGPVLPRPL
jgi:hypothetical protein